jgi:cyanate permease
MDRNRLSLAIELLVWIAAAAVIVLLLFDFVATRSLLSLAAFVVMALLVWWPMIRTRIKFGYWMRDWDDHPARHFSEVGAPDRPQAGSRLP